MFSCPSSANVVPVLVCMPTDAWSLRLAQVSSAWKVSHSHGDGAWCGVKGCLLHQPRGLSEPGISAEPMDTTDRALQELRGAQLMMTGQMQCRIESAEIELM